MAMKTQLILQPTMPLWIQLSALLAMPWVIACSSNNEAPGGGRLAHPTSTPPSSTPTPTPSQSASSSLAMDVSPSVSVESPIDKAIREDVETRLWSKNVPERSCTHDNECGDGFCDRGRCAAVWTGAGILGQRCTTNARCVSYLCIDGRCRSCVSDAECIDEPDNQDPTCVSKPFVPGSRGCVGVVGSGGWDVVPSPLRSVPKK